MTSPSDAMAARMDTCAFACVPRNLVEEFAALLAEHPGENVSLGEAFEYTDRVNAAAREIADAALDDIS